MKPSNLIPWFTCLMILALLAATPLPALAQDSAPASPTPQPLTLYTQYPSQMIGFGEVVTVSLKLKAGKPQTVRLEVQNLPAGWTASFRGGTKIIDAVYVDGKGEASVDLRLEQPADVQAGKYEIAVAAIGEGEKAELLLRFTINEKLPPRLSLKVNGLPNKRGAPSATFNFTLDLKNEGGEDLLATLSTTQLENAQVTIQSGGQDVTELQLAANETKSLTVKIDPLVNLEAGRYSVTVQAAAGEVKAQQEFRGPMGAFRARPTPGRTTR